MSELKKPLTEKLNLILLNHGGSTLEKQKEERRARAKNMIPEVKF